MLGNPAYINNKPRLVMNSQRSMILFHNIITSAQTREHYDFELEKFRNFCRIRDFDSMLSLEPKKSQEMVEDYVFSLKAKGLRGNGIRSRLAGIKMFYYVNDVILNWDKIFRMLKEERKSGNDKAYSKKEIVMLLDKTKQITHKALILLLASSGCRVGAISELHVRDIQDFGEGCKCIKVYSDTKYEYHTFLTPEASDYLDKHLEIMKKTGIGSNDLVFPAKSKSYSTMISRVSRQLRGKKIDNRYEIAGLHGLRKFFDTVLKGNNDVNPNIAEKLTGHSKTFYLDNVYFKPTLDSMFAEYKKAIPDLTITKEYLLNFEIDKQSKQIQNYESNDQKIIQLQTMFSQLQEHLNNISNKMNHPC